MQVSSVTLDKYPAPGAQMLMSLALYETDVGAAEAARLQACLPCLQVPGFAQGISNRFSQICFGLHHLLWRSTCMCTS